MNRQHAVIGFVFGYLASTILAAWSETTAPEAPTETTGIIASAVHGVQSLDNEFQDCKGKLLRVREIVVAPGGQLAVHQHQNRPEVAYVLEGQMTEHRTGKPPTVQIAGTTLFAMQGTEHWLRNNGREPVRALTIDIVEQEATQ